MSLRLHALLAIRHSGSSPSLPPPGSFRRHIADGERDSLQPVGSGPPRPRHHACTVTTVSESDLPADCGAERMRGVERHRGGTP